MKAITVFFAASLLSLIGPPAGAIVVIPQTAADYSVNINGVSLSGHVFNSSAPVIKSKVFDAGENHDSASTLVSAKFGILKLKANTAASGDRQIAGSGGPGLLL